MAGYPGAGYPGQSGAGYPGQPGAGYPGQPGYGAPQGGYGQPLGYGAPSAYPGMPGAVDPMVMQWFQSVDADRTGRLNVLELQRALTNANWSNFNLETCRLMIGMFDRDRTGQIEVNEFQALWSYMQQWKTTFDQFDRDRSGSIDSNELNNAFMQMGYRLSPQFSVNVVFRYDSIGRTRLTLDNFIQACILMRTMTDAFKQRDPQQRGTVQMGYEEFLSLVMMNKY